MTTNSKFKLTHKTDEWSIESPDWRLQACINLYKLDKSQYRVSDEYINRGIAFLKAWETGDLPTLSIRIKDAAVFDAFICHRDRANERYALEGAILTGASCGEIAKYFGMSTEAVFAYEKLFWDIRSKLENKGWIVANILKPAAKDLDGTNNLSDAVSKRLSIFEIAFNHGWKVFCEVYEGGRLSSSTSILLRETFKNTMLLTGLQALKKGIPNRKEVCDYISAVRAMVTDTDKLAALSGSNNTPASENGMAEFEIANAVNNSTAGKTWTVVDGQYVPVEPAKELTNNVANSGNKTDS